MARACPNCRWYSSDAVDVCPHCGALLPEPVPLETEEPQSPLWTVWSLIQSALGLTALGLLGYLVYTRYGPELRGGYGAVRTAWHSFATWLVGPGGEYVDFIALAIVLSIIFWLILWLVERIRSLA